MGMNTMLMGQLGSLISYWKFPFLCWQFIRVSYSDFSGVVRYRYTPRFFSLYSRTQESTF